MDLSILNGWPHPELFSEDNIFFITLLSFTSDIPFVNSCNTQKENFRVRFGAEQNHTAATKSSKI